MRKAFFVIIFLLLCGFGEDIFCFSQDTIEIDLAKREVKFVDFNLGNSKLDGNFFFTLNKEDGSLIFDLEGKDITFRDKNISWLKMKLIKKSSVIFINYLSLPQLTVTGRVDLDKSQLALNVDGRWSGGSGCVEGQIRVKAKAWGSFSNFLVSGYLTGEDGKYKNKEFSQIRLDFFGKPPLFNITDSKVILKSGSVLEVRGVLDLRDFSNLIPGAEFVAQKVFIDEWQLFAGDDENVGLKKSIDKKLDVFLNTNRKRDEVLEAGAELRYSWRDNKFLKFKIQESESIFKFEQRKDF